MSAKSFSNKPLPRPEPVGFEPKQSYRCKEAISDIRSFTPIGKYLDGVPRMIRILPAFALAITACASEPAPAQSAQAPITGVRQPAAPPFVATPVAKFESPWAMTFLPDGRMLITEKKGRLLLVSADGKREINVTGIPKVDSEGQGGLMDVIPAPDFAQTRMIYFSYSERGRSGKGVVLARATLSGDIRCIRTPCPPSNALNDVTVLFRAHPLVGGNGHYSGRIAFSPDKQFLFFTNGERQKFTPAQNPTASLGKVLRLTLDGKPAPGNPLAAKGFDPAIWSYGHRNLLGIAFDAQGRLWEQEMGPMGGDELNLILPGRNYGYPIVSNGSHYDGRDIPDHPTRPEYEAPKVSWNPVISPAGLMIYSGSLFSAWKGNIFIGGLSSESLIRVEVNGDTAKEAARYAMGARIREVEQAPDGAIWLLEDEGRLLKLTPK
jgi:aldose sugar dehydrogenase